MNSVMDDNRLLTLPSNERIPLKAISGKERTTVLIRYKDLYMFFFKGPRKGGLINGIFSRFVVFGGGGGVLDDLNSWHCFFQETISKLGNIERFPLEKSTHSSAVSR